VDKSPHYLLLLGYVQLLTNIVKMVTRVT